MALLVEFANQGFRKTSMVVLADAINVSRQTLYNRFNSKEAVLNWATNELIQNLRADALNCLGNPDKPPGALLLEAFSHWLGPIVQLLNEGRHGEEFLGLTTGKPHHASRDPLDGFTAEISKFLVAHKVCASSRVAGELSFLLVMAAKGLMLTSESETEFRTGMARAIRGAGIVQKPVSKK